MDTIIGHSLFIFNMLNVEDFLLRAVLVKVNFFLIKPTILSNAQFSIPLTVHVGLASGQ